LRSAVKVIFVSVARDIGNTFRIWRRNPGSTLAAYLALTVGIGATTTIFSVLSSLLLSPLPVADSNHVVRVTGLDRGNHAIELSMPDALDIKQQTHLASRFAFFRNTLGNLADQSRPAMVHILAIDADLFEVLGVRMAQGRRFHSDANKPGAACEVVLSWPFWRRQFGGQWVSGRTLRLNGNACLIDGVLPQDLDLPGTAEIWKPLSFDLHILDNGRAIRSFVGLAHLKSGVDVSAFNAELTAVFIQLSREHPMEDTGLSAHAVLLRDWLTQDVQGTIFILFGAVSGVLLMACANVANLLLARSSARLREVALRVAIGANRVMLFQQLLIESMVLGLTSSLSGLVLATLAVRFLRALPDTQIPRMESVTVDWRVLLFAIVAAVITGALFGTAPALRVSSSSPTGILNRAGERMSETRRQQFIRQLLVGAETAIATVLLIVSLLLLRSFAEVSRIDPGFATDHLLTAYLSLPLERYGKDTKDSARFARSVLERLKNNAGVENAALATAVPLQSTSGSGPVQIEGGVMPVHEGDSPFVLNTGVTAGFRKTLKIPLLAGRDLTDGDDKDASAVLVNAAFAKLFFPQQNVVGKRLRYSPNINPGASWQEIVGVIGDTRQNGLEDAVQPELYAPLSRSTTLYPAVIIRTANRPLPHLRDIENAVRAVDAGVPVFLPRTMQQVEARSLGARTFNTELLTGFASVALLLACGGIFAVIAYSVSQRTSEIGLRMACGATPGDVTRLIVGQGLFPAWIGIAAGLLAALIVSRYLSSLLYGVRPIDLTSYAGAVVMLMGCSALAAWLPAWRAARVDPWRALRYE
jgi:putative ABC transport system permease protein